MEALIIGLIIVIVGQLTALGLLWRKVGSLEIAIRKACPFGGCPFYERALHEAAPDREIMVKIKPVVERVDTQKV